jgi:hypothetical protein
LIDDVYAGDNARCGEVSPAYPKAEFFRSLFSRAVKDRKYIGL